MTEESQTTPQTTDTLVLERLDKIIELLQPLAMSARKSLLTTPAGIANHIIDVVGARLAQQED